MDAPAALVRGRRGPGRRGAGRGRAVAGAASARPHRRRAAPCWRPPAPTSRGRCRPATTPARCGRLVVLRLQLARRRRGAGRVSSSTWWPARNCSSCQLRRRSSTRSRSCGERPPGPGACRRPSPRRRARGPSRSSASSSTNSSIGTRDGVLVGASGRNCLRKRTSPIAKSAGVSGASSSCRLPLVVDVLHGHPRPGLVRVGVALEREPLVQRAAATRVVDEQRVHPALDRQPGPAGRPRRRRCRARPGRACRRPSPRARPV